jgi:hypothetical protein
MIHTSETRLGIRFSGGISMFCLAAIFLQNLRRDKSLVSETAISFPKKSKARKTCRRSRRCDFVAISGPYLCPQMSYGTYPNPVMTKQHSNVAFLSDRHLHDCPDFRHASRGELHGRRNPLCLQ